MAHILVFDLPGGNDFAVLEDALELGHQVTLCTNNLAHYAQLGEEALQQLSRLTGIVEVPDFDEEILLNRLEERHAKSPFHAVICLLDIRLLAASRVAQRLGLKFLSPDVVKLTRNKTAVRARLKERGIAQPGFAQAASPAELIAALEKTGYPAIVKPSDGYGSESLFYLETADDLASVQEKLFSDETGIDYGLGVRSNRLYSVEPYARGQLIGVDVFSDGATRLMLGINEKKMFPPPSFAIAGSCFPTANLDFQKVQAFAFSVLDALDFDFGAAHIEIIAQDGQFYLVEVNARLVSAQIPYQMAYAFERSIYADLIDLHLGVPVEQLEPFKREAFSVIRWVIAKEPGKLEVLDFPEVNDPNIRRIAVFKNVGDRVSPPLANADRIAYIIAAASTEAEATRSAENYVNHVQMRIAPCTP